MNGIVDKSLRVDHLTLGVCYYPEHWDSSLWAGDLDRMLAMGIEVVRVFEFAWNMVEPTEGCFDFAYFDSFLQLAAEKGMRVILCTPTATPPAWLTEAHPEVLNADVGGALMHHGHRRHYNYTSPVYHEYTRRIVTALAERYGQHPAVIGWQIDNEINCEIDVFYAQSDRDAFRAYLRRRFGTLEALNEAIGARFWNQTYTDWAQVDLLRTTLHGHANPHMALLEKAFISECAISYVKLQSDILRRYVGDRFITTNGMFGHLDNHAMTESALDCLFFDSYPNFAHGQDTVDKPSWVNGGLADRKSSWYLSKVRSVSPNFGIMEQQAAAQGWVYNMVAPMPEPGQLRLWTYQSIAHGADFVSYFRWRTCTVGTEIYWHGLNDYANRPNRRLAEVERTHGELTRLAQVAGSRYQARVAMLSDYLNEWDGERDQWHGPLDKRSREAIFFAAQHSHTPMDSLQIDTLPADTALETLLRYRLCIYPHATILTPEIAALLTRYCEAGGTLIMGARTGYKDAFGRCVMQPMPGLAGPLCGVEVTDYTFTRFEGEAPVIDWEGRSLMAPTFHDILAPIEGGKVCATFRGGYYDGQPAVVEKAYPGGGRAAYVGAGFSPEMTDALLERYGSRSPYQDLLGCPPQVELACRVQGEEAIYFLLNYTGEACAVTVGQPMTDALGGGQVQGEITLEPYGVRVLRARAR